MGEVYDCRLVRFKRRAAPSFLVQSVVDDGFDAQAVTLRGGSRDPCREVVDKRDGPSVAINVSLYQVGVKEEEENRRQRRALS